MKRMVTALLAALLLALSFACSAEETYPVCEFDLDAYGENGGMLYFTYADGTIEETGGWGFGVELDGSETTIGALLAKYDVTNVEAACEGDVFEGWIAFDISIRTDEFGFDEYIYTPASDVILTTEELMASPLPESYTIYAAKWASIPVENYYQPIEEEVFYMTAATLYANEGAMLMHSEEEDYESSMNVATVEPGQLVYDALEMENLLSITREGYEFAGWTVYDVAEMETVEGEIDAGGLPCFEVYDGWYTVLRDYTVLSENMSTEEVGQLVCGETDFFIVAQWK